LSTEVGRCCNGDWNAGEGIGTEEVRGSEPISFQLGFKFCANNCSLGCANRSEVNKDWGVGKGPKVEPTIEEPGLWTEYWGEIGLG